MVLKMIKTNPVNSAFNKVYDLIQQVPKGKVTTYGEIGKKLTISVPISKSAAKMVEKAGGKIEG